MAFVIQCEGVVIDNSTQLEPMNFRCETAQGAYQAWQVIDVSDLEVGLLGEPLSISDAEDIVSAALLLWAVAWGARQVYDLINRPHTRRD